MLVSVIVPNYNHALFLQQRIDSILNQSFQDFELIILDDCSTDNSRGVIEQYRNYKQVSHIVYNTTNSGSPFAQWKKGIQLAVGDYIWIAESDDYAEPLFLEKLLLLTQNYPTAGICFANSHWIDAKNNIKESLSLYNTSFFKNGLEVIRETLVKYNNIQNVSACLLQKKQLLNALEGLKKYKAAGDWLFYYRILLNSDLAYTNECLNYFRWYHNNTSNVSFKSGKTLAESIQIFTEMNITVLKLGMKEKYRVWYYWNCLIKTGAIENKIKLKYQLRIFTKLISS